MCISGSIYLTTHPIRCQCIFLLGGGGGGDWLGMVTGRIKTSWLSSDRVINAPRIVSPCKECLAFDLVNKEKIFLNLELFKNSKIC